MPILRLLNPPVISVVIPFGGKDSSRERNLLQCLLCLSEQTLKNFEIIIVEQSLDGNYYQEWVKDKGIRWIGISDPLNRGFNLSWCRNVGVRESNGKKVVLLDSDMCFESEYLQKVLESNSVFSLGAKLYHWIRKEDVTSIYIRDRDFKRMYIHSEGGQTDDVHRFFSIDRDNGSGASLVFDKKWYLDSFGGYCEDFFRYGWEDKAGIEVIKKILNIKTKEELDVIEYDMIHLSHGGKDYKNLKTNEALFESIKEMDIKEWIDKTKNNPLGDKKSPKIILDYESQ